MTRLVSSTPGHSYTTTYISTSPLDTHQTLSYLHQLFLPNSQALSSFFKTYLQPTSEDLSFLKSITVSCKICLISDSNSGYHSTLFLPIRLEVPFLELTGNLTLPTCPLSDMPSTFWSWRTLSWGGWKHFPQLTKGLRQSLNSSFERLSPRLVSQFPSRHT